eukprot:1158266-Pelagomonas_calceolata.AAC.13
MDILCMAGTVVQAEQPNYLAEGQISLSPSFPAGSRNGISTIKQQDPCSDLFFVLEGRYYPPIV